MVRELTLSPTSSPTIWQEFSPALTHIDPTKIPAIENAFLSAEEWHKNQSRASGEAYFFHPVATALELLDECEISDSDIIVATLFHDVPEDTDIVPKEVTYSEWKAALYEKLRYEVGERAAEMIVAVTKPFEDGVEITSKEQAMEVYFENLRNASDEAILVKMADRLHNLRTLNARNPNKRLEIIRETIEEYFPIFQRENTRYSKETETLLGAMELAMKEAVAQLKWEFGGT